MNTAFIEQLLERIHAKPHGMLGYGISIILMAIALTLRLVIWPVDAGLQYVTFFPAVAITAVFAGFWPGLLSVAIGLMLASFIFTYPYYSLSLEAIDNSLWSNLVFLADGLIVCFSIEAMHRFRLSHLQKLKEVQQAHAESERNRHYLDSIINNVLDGIITIDAQGNITSCNEATTKLFGYSEAELIGQGINMLMPEPDRSRHDEYLQRYLDTGEQKIIGVGRDVTGLRKDGSVFPMELAVCEVRDELKRSFVGIVRDISIRKAHEAHMNHIAHHDQLTGLPNRMLFTDRLQQLLARTRREPLKFALMFVDLDNFKPVNDTLGHDTGDLLLQEATTRLQRCLRESDTAARIGGDEFVVLLPTITSANDAQRVAEKIRHALSQPFALSGNRVNISCSIGIALYPEHGSKGKLLIKHADTAMYHAKRSGRNEVVLYTPELDNTDRLT